MSKDLPLVITSRIRYITQAEYIGFPSGTECWASRKPPNWNIHLEFDDGTIVELSENQYDYLILSDPNSNNLI